MSSLHHSVGVLCCVLWLLSAGACGRANAAEGVEELNQLRLFFTPSERVLLADGDVNKTSVSMIDDSNLPADQSTPVVRHVVAPVSTTYRQNAGLSGNAYSLGITFDALIVSDTGVTVVLEGIPCKRLSLSSLLPDPGGQRLRRLSCPHMKDRSLELLFVQDTRQVRVKRRGRLLSQLRIGQKPL